MGGGGCRGHEEWGVQSKCSNNNCNQWLLVRAEIGRILPDIWPVITVMPLQTATVWQVKCVCSQKKNVLKSSIAVRFVCFYDFLEDSKEVACPTKLKQRKCL